MFKISKYLTNPQQYLPSDCQIFQIKMFKIDNDWQDGIAKKQLLMIFDHLGPENEIAKKGRRLLTSLIFS